MGVSVSLPVLLLPVLFALGFGASWWLTARSRRFQLEQLQALRSDRHRLAQKLLMARDRLAKRQELGRRLKRDNERLLQAQDHLETEHAALAVSYANLQSTIDTSPGDSFEVPTLSELSGDSLSADTAWLTDSNPVRSAPTHERNPPRVLHQTPDLDDSLLSAIPAEGSIHKVSTRLLEATIEQADPENDLRQQAIETLAEFEAELLADEPAQRILPTAASGNAGSTDLASLLADRDAEIDRLREQIAPLIGLPLAISAREAERDQLARRLEETEAKLALLETGLREQPGATQAESRSFSPPTDRLETAPGLLDALDRADLEINGPRKEVSTNLQDESQSPTPQFDQVPDQVDNLKRIRGIGPVLERMLNRLGIYQYRQIAEWTDEDVAFFDSKLHDFRGRIERDNWIAGARRQVERQQSHAPQGH